MKKEKIHVFYDEGGDLLEIRIGNVTPSHMEPLGNDVFERIDNKTGKVKGYMIVNFRKKMRKNTSGIEFPITVLEAEA